MKEPHCSFNLRSAGGVLKQVACRLRREETAKASDMSQCPEHADGVDVGLTHLKLVGSSL